MRKQSGFTLIEILVVMAILGLLAAIAIPSYQQAIRKSNRADAQISMSRLATLQERYFFQNNNYTGDFADLISGAVSGDPVASDEGHYSITLAATGGGTGWNMIATPVGDQLNDNECISITLNSLGVKAGTDSLGAASAECW